MPRMEALTRALVKMISFWRRGKRTNAPRTGVWIWMDDVTCERILVKRLGQRQRW